MATHRSTSSKTLRRLVSATVAVASFWFLVGPSSVPAAQTNMTIGWNLWDIGWGRGTLDYFKDGTNFSTVTNPWKQEFLDDLRGATCIRFMDWAQANSCEHENWSERTAKTSQNQNPVAWEWMIDLCNRSGCDMWICVPPKTSSDYHFQLAQLVYQNLNPGLKVYLEWANETWNGMMLGYEVSIERGTALNLPGMNRWYRSWAYHVYAAVRLFEQFERVFGKDSPRLVKVIAGQADWDTDSGGNTDMARWHLQMLDDPTVNPNRTKANAYSIAPYTGGGSIEVVRANIAGSIRRSRMYKSVVGPAGLKLIAYEGGQHSTSNAAQVNRDPRIYQLYLDYFNAMDTIYDGVFCHYTLYSVYGDGGAWGAKEYCGQPIEEAHKYRAIQHWIAAHHPLHTAFPAVPIFEQETRRETRPYVFYSLRGQVVAGGQGRRIMIGRDARGAHLLFPGATE